MNEEKREKESLKKQKRIILIVIASMIVFSVVYFLIGLIDFDSIFNKPDENEGSGGDTATKIYFYDESYSKDPSKDEWYMKEAFKNITYVYGSGTVFSDEIQNADDAKAKNESLLLLYNMIEFIKAGDSEGYNNCLSSFYFSNHERQGEFTKQKIYDIIITEISTQTKSADGKTFIEYTFTLEYRIRHNNGSLRSDVGSDQSKKQYISISERSGQGLKIDDIYVLKETVIN